VTAASFAVIISNPLVGNDDNQNPADNDPFNMPLNDSAIFIHSDISLISLAQARNWTGNGTSDAPISIEGLGIQSSDCCIYIESVSLHFIIQNCTLVSEPDIYNGLGIYLRNCSHALIRSCAVSAGLSGIEVFETNNTVIEDCLVQSRAFAVNVSGSTHSKIMNNEIRGNFSGISVICSNQTQILNNTVTRGRFGLFSQFSFYCNMSDNVLGFNEDGAMVEGRCSNWHILGNTFLNNSRRGISLRQNASFCVIYGNSLGWNLESNALDDGFANMWDNGIGIGNYWHDYSGIGTYAIPGSANSVDNYPSILT
jgi:parallel beta-helix repeat protein